MRAAICDDNLIFLEEMKSRLEKKNVIKDVKIFSSPLELLLQINEGIIFDLVFMDLDWGSDEKKNGFQWGEELCQIVPDLSIIFITGYNDRFAQHVLLSNVNLIGYITKPVNDEILDQYLQKAKESRKEPQYLMLSKQGGRISVLLDDIIHIESHDHKVCVYTEKECHTIYEKLSEVEKRLTNEFVQCHKSFVVNMNWISSLEGKKIILRNGKEIPVSRTYNNKVRDTFFDFLGRSL